MYRLAIIHFVSDRWTDGQTDRRQTTDYTIVPTADHTACRSTIG